MPPAVVIPTVIGTTAAIVYSKYVTQKEMKQAEEAGSKEAEKQRKLQEKMFGQELQAGEYFEQLNMKQMELQAQSSNISTLANLIAEKNATAAQPQVFTLPAAKTYSPVEQINQAIDKMLRG